MLLRFCMSKGQLLLATELSNCFRHNLFTYWLPLKQSRIHLWSIFLIAQYSEVNRIIVAQEHMRFLRFNILKYPLSSCLHCSLKCSFDVHLHVHSLALLKITTPSYCLLIVPPMPCVEDEHISIRPKLCRIHGINFKRGSILKRSSSRWAAMINQKC